MHTKYERVQARVFVEIISYTETATEDGIYMFKVEERRDLYGNSYKNLVTKFKSIKRNLKNPFLITLKSLVYKNNQTERTKYLFF